MPRVVDAKLLTHSSQYEINFRRRQLYHVSKNAIADRVLYA